MQSINENDEVGEGQALALVAESPSWYATAPTLAVGWRELQDEHTRILAQAVGDHPPYELALRAAELAAQLRHTP